MKRTIKQDFVNDIFYKSDVTNVWSFAVDFHLEDIYFDEGGVRGSRRDTAL